MVKALGKLTSWMSALRLCKVALMRSNVDRLPGTRSAETM
jgi:hypothetical protein